MPASRPATMATIQISLASLWGMKDKPEKKKIGPTVGCPTLLATFLQAPSSWLTSTQYLILGLGLTSPTTPTITTIILYDHTSDREHGMV